VTAPPVLKTVILANGPTGKKGSRMTDRRTTPASGRFEVRVTADSHFAWVRTRLALERTIMSWVRTAVALIGFGFAIVQYLEHLQQIPGARSAHMPEAPRYLGLALIGCGILALLISIWQYLWTVRYLWGGSFTPLAGMTTEGMHSPVIAVAIVLILIGLFAFSAVLLRLS
jgi:putative membrane protein